MEQKKMKTLKDKLLQKKKEILEAYSKNKAYGMEADGQGAQDIADKASNSYAKEFLFSLSNSERETLQLVDEALLRIGEKNFGYCASCEGEMERKRLEAIPWAKHCLSCQEKQEQGLL
jgi:DnaK suppressor protein